MKYITVEGTKGVIAVPGNWKAIEATMVEEESTMLFNKGVTTFVVDFSETKFIDSFSLQGLVRLREMVGKEHFSCRAVSGEPLKLFRGASLMDWIRE